MKHPHRGIAPTKPGPRKPPPAPRVRITAGMIEVEACLTVQVRPLGPYGPPVDWPGVERVTVDARDYHLARRYIWVELRAHGAPQAVSYLLAAGREVEIYVPSHRYAPSATFNRCQLEGASAEVFRFIALPGSDGQVFSLGSWGAREEAVR